MGDQYAILGLEHLTYEAGEGDIKTAYRKLALMYHPDKMGEDVTEKSKEIWLNVQNAYETLINPAKRRKYDSTLPFDDNIPTEESKLVNDDNFYDTFEPVFKNNARFAVKKPVPNIGDSTTPLDQVYKFYKYWDNFATWREFSQFDEYNPSEAQDRYERRYMEKENKKMSDKHMKKERTRLIKLAELAYKLDPRIKAEKFKEEQVKLLAKQEVKDRKALARKEVEDRLKAEEDAKQAEIIRKKEEDIRNKN